MSLNSSIILPLTYLGAVQYFSHLLNAKEIIVEQHNHYQRKTYANRCKITGANGPLSLAVPVTKNKGKEVTKDIRISYDTDWQKQHWRSIVSAYNSSPFFEYYADDFAPYYEKKHTFLVDFNMGLLQTVLDQIEVEANIQLSETYFENDTPNYTDLRRHIHPKAEAELDKHFRILPYRQVFAEKYSFVPNLSVIDLLFSKGPETYDILKVGIVK